MPLPTELRACSPKLIFSSVEFNSALDNTCTLTYHYSFQFSSVWFNSVQFSSVQFNCFMPKRIGPEYFWEVLLVYDRLSDTNYFYYTLYDTRQKRRGNGREIKLCIFMGNKDVENKTRILYNCTIKSNWIEKDVALLFLIQNVTGSNHVIPT